MRQGLTQAKSLCHGPASRNSGQQPYATFEVAKLKQEN